MGGRTRPPVEMVAKVGAICLGLPEAIEEAAWTGTRWTVAKRNFAHVVQIERGWPPAYAKAAGTPGPVTVLTFRLPLANRNAPRYARAPFFRPPWFADIVGMAIDRDSEWDDIAELLAESYCVLAPKKLAALVERPRD